MARAAKLKVYRTAIGFHDAYVAAPSQKAALQAWGSDHDLFGRGIAEQVTDPALMAEPLEKPGHVVKRLRGTADEQIAALPKDPPRRPPAPGPLPDQRTADPASKAIRTARGTGSAARAKAAPPPPKPPRPSRAQLDEAERAVDAARTKFEAEHAALRARERALADERRDLVRREEAEVARAEQARDHAEAAYQQALAAWRA